MIPRSLTKFNEISSILTL